MSRPIILVVCSANRARSPMVQTLLSHQLPRRGLDAEVVSAGTIRAAASAQPMVAEAAAALASLGLEPRGHRSRRLTPDIASAALIVTMERRHVRDVVGCRQDAWPRTFTLKELVRRGQQVGGRRAGESWDGWLARVHAGRARRELLGSDPADDVADPMGKGAATFDRTLAELRPLVEDLTDLLAEGQARASQP